MRRPIWVLAAAFLAAASTSGAQTSGAPLSSIELAIACAPPPTLSGAPEHALHIIGTQDSVPRTAFGGRDLIVLDGGTEAGVQLGQQFFVRRANRFGMYGPGRGRGATTVGWLHVVAVNDSTAIAQVDHTCGALIASDYLEPYFPPLVPAGIDGGDTTGEPDFGDLGRVINGSEGRTTFGGGDFALIDRGSDHGVTAGQRFSIYRDMRQPGVPLASIGEAVVISAGDSVAVARITQARDAVIEGDYVALRK
jgi:hypothetical protein